MLLSIFGLCRYGADIWILFKINFLICSQTLVFLNFTKSGIYSVTINLVIGMVCLWIHVSKMLFIENFV